MPRSHSASSFQHLDMGESPTLSHRLSTSLNRLSMVDVQASAGAPDEEGRINDPSDALDSKFKLATIG
jgi:hypothetical protein